MKTGTVKKKRLIPSFFFNKLNYISKQSITVPRITSSDCKERQRAETAEKKFGITVALNVGI